MKALKVVGTIGRFALAGVLIAGHFVMNIIGALNCAITSQGKNGELLWKRKKQRRRERQEEVTRNATKTNASKRAAISER